MGCWSKGDIGGITPETKLNDIFTAEECQFQCKNNGNCFHFKFDERSNTCFLYGKEGVDKYIYHDPLQAGPKQCEIGKFFHCKILQRCILIKKLGRFSLFYVGLAFVYIDSESATFVQGDLGIDSCPEGHETITEPSTCEIASKLLGLRYMAHFNTGGVNAICNLCEGCSPQYTRVSDNHGPKARWICKLQGTYQPCLVQENTILST